MSRLATLKAELVAIELWDSDYYRAEMRDSLDEVAHRQRQERRENILTEILSITRIDPRTFRLSFF